MNQYDAMFYWSPVAWLDLVKLIQSDASTKPIMTQPNESVWYIVFLFEKVVSGLRTKGE